ncbi:cathepsin L-like [Symsagittifera roscoffensis]|uniref:cathepsin L-like n=1 Tax=Symsagittifera roscoffensis TaxID=84072 RepID=UPI00307BCA8A
MTAEEFASQRLGTLVSLSEQQLVDCEYVDNGCHGGLTSDALTWVIKNGGSAVATFSTFIATPRYNEDYLKTAVASVGPISIAIDASGHAFQLYRRGIYNPTSCNQYLLNHGVLIADGYGSEDGTDYWLVKNSWGANWGEAGYIKMIRNENNKCGIASQAVYPLV